MTALLVSAAIPLYVHGSHLLAMFIMGFMCGIAFTAWAIKYGNWRK